MEISSIWGIIKDAVNVSRNFSHTELKQKFIEVSDAALNLQKRIDELERENRQLHEQQDLKNKIERTTDGYFTLKGENPSIRYCTHCWDAKHLTIQVGEDRTPGSFFCPECNASGVYDKEKFKKFREEQQSPASVRRNISRYLG